MASTSVSTHKRTSSTAGNTTEAPESKRRVEGSSSTAIVKPQKLYVVTVTNKPQYGEDSRDIRGIYSTIEDANNCVRGLAGDDFTCAEDARYSSEDGGRVSWASDDVGEGDGAEIDIEVHELKEAGSEPAQEWPSGARESDGEGRIASHREGDSEDDEY